MTYRNYGPISKSFRYYRVYEFIFPVKVVPWEFGNAGEGQKSELMAEKFHFDVQ